MGPQGGGSALLPLPSLLLPEGPHTHLSGHCQGIVPPLAAPCLSPVQALCPQALLGLHTTGLHRHKQGGVGDEARLKGQLGVRLCFK